MNEITTIDIMNKYDMKAILDAYDIKVVYGETFMAMPKVNAIVVPETIRDCEIEDYDFKIAPYVNEMYGIELNPDSEDEICIFNVLHEMGHILDFRRSDMVQCQKSYDKHRNKLDKKVDKINKKVNKLHRLHDKVLETYEATYESTNKISKTINKICSKVGQKLMDTTSKLLSEPDKLYRQIPHEQRADQFAIKLLYTVLNGTKTTTC